MIGTTSTTRLRLAPSVRSSTWLNSGPTRCRIASTTCRRIPLTVDFARYFERTLCSVVDSLTSSSAYPFTVLVEADSQSMVCEGNQLDAGQAYQGFSLAFSVAM